MKGAPHHWDRCAQSIQTEDLAWGQEFLLNTFHLHVFSTDKRVTGIDLGNTGCVTQLSSQENENQGAGHWWEEKHTK